MAAGYPAGGWLGDEVVQAHQTRPPDRQRDRRFLRYGGPVVCHAHRRLTGAPCSLSCFASPPSYALCFTHIISTMYDVTVPEIRSSAAMPIESFLNPSVPPAPLACRRHRGCHSVGNSIIYIAVSPGRCVSYSCCWRSTSSQGYASLHNELEARAVEAKAS